MSLRSVLAGTAAFVLLTAPLPLAGGPDPEEVVVTVCSERSCDYQSIQEAVDSVSVGVRTTVELGPETFYENVVFRRLFFFEFAVTIRGAGPGRTIVDGGAAGRVFEIFAKEMVLADMTIQNGFAAFGGGISAATWDRVTIDNVVVRDNVAGTAGGVFAFPMEATYDGHIVISNSLISGNSGGGVSAASFPGWEAYGGGEATIRSSTITGNVGPGVTVEKKSTIDGSVITENTGPGVVAQLAPPYCNGVRCDYYPIESMEIDSSTVARNGAEGVACLAGHLPLALTLSNSTITDNAGAAISAVGGCVTELSNVTLDGDSTGAFVANETGRYHCCRFPFCGPFCPYSVDPEVRMDHVIVRGAQGPACSGDVSAISSGHNLSGDYSCAFSEPTDIEGEDPLLLPLDDYGGPTPTRALHPDSLAIDAGGETCLPTDQRGAPRPLDGDGDEVALCDVGAVEFRDVEVRPIADLAEMLVDLQGQDSRLVTPVQTALSVLSDEKEWNDSDAVASLLTFVDALESDSQSVDPELATDLGARAREIIRQLVSS